MPTESKDFKLFICSILFVICYSCVLCEIIYSIPEPHVEIGVPKGLRITIENPKISITYLLASVVVYNETDKGDRFIFGDYFSRSGNQWILDKKDITIKPGQRIKFGTWAYTGDREYEYSVFNNSASPQQSRMAATRIYDPLTAHVKTNYYFPELPRATSDDCNWSKTTVQGRKVCQGKLIFQDDFDFFNETIWNRDIRIPLDIDDGDFVVYRNDRKNFSIQKGFLFIAPALYEQYSGMNVEKMRRGKLDLGPKCTGIVDRERECNRKAEGFMILPPIVSTRINTKKSFSFRYGKIEVRAKLPVGDWIFPLIVLDPLMSEYGISGYASGQMRIAFARGNKNLKTKEGWAIDGSYLSGGVVLTPGEKDRDKWLKTVHGSEHWGNKVHTYTLTWTEKKISLAYDGITYATISGGFNHTSGSKTAPFDKEFYISLGVSAGGVSDFPDESVSNSFPKPWQNTHPKAELNFWNARNQWLPTWNSSIKWLAIDHVKVWAL